MVAKISVGSSLYGAIAYNGEKINEAQGRLLTTNRIYNDGSGTVDINKAMEDFLTFLPPQMMVKKPVVHISLNPHPEDVLTDIELQNIAREYLEKPFLLFFGPPVQLWPGWAPSPRRRSLIWRSFFLVAAY